MEREGEGEGEREREKGRGRERASERERQAAGYSLTNLVRAQRLQGHGVVRPKTLRCNGVVDGQTGERMEKKWVNERIVRRARNHHVKSGRKTEPHHAFDKKTAPMQTRDVVTTFAPASLTSSCILKKP